MNAISAQNESSTRTRRGIGFTGLAVASFLGCIDLTIVTTALPELTRSLGTSLALSQLTLSVFLVALAISMVTAGRLADRYGRRRVLLIGLAVFVAASVAAALAPSIAVLVGARFVAGSACATLYTSTSVLVESLFAEGERGRAIGLLYAVNGVGLAIGPVLGGVLVPVWGWPAIFWINLPLGVIAIAAIVYGVTENRSAEPAGTDWPGLVAVAVTVLGAIGVPVLGDTVGWLSPAVAASAVVAVLGAVLTVVVERRASDPLLKLSLLRHRAFSAAISSDFFLAFFYASALLTIPLYLTAGRGFDVRTTGLLLLLVSATMAVTSPQVGKLVDRRGPIALLTAGFVAFTAAGAAISTGAVLGWLPLTLAGLVLFGLGWASTLGPATVAALSSVDDAQASFAVGASWTFHNFGGALGASIAGGVFASAPDAASGLGRVAGVLTATSVVALISVLLLGRRGGTVTAQE